MRTDAAMLFQEKVFVALPEESGESNLCWVLEHASSSAEIIIMHVKRRQTGSSILSSPTLTVRVLMRQGSFAIYAKSLNHMVHQYLMLSEGFPFLLSSSA